VQRFPGFDQPHGAKVFSGAERTDETPAAERIRVHERRAALLEEALERSSEATRGISIPNNNGASMRCWIGGANARAETTAIDQPTPRRRGDDPRYSSPRDWRQATP
jgi:hypothetical protein